MKILSYPKIKNLLLICLRLSHLSSQSICKLTHESEVDKGPNEFSSNTDNQFSTPFMEQSKLSSLVCNDTSSFPEDVIRGSLLYRTPVLPSSVYSSSDTTLCSSGLPSVGAGAPPPSSPFHANLLVKSKHSIPRATTFLYILDCPKSSFEFFP